MKSERGSQIPYENTYMWNLKSGTMKLSMKEIHTENTLVVAGGGGEGAWGGIEGQSGSLGLANANHYIRKG